MTLSFDLNGERNGTSTKGCCEDSIKSCRKKKNFQNGKHSLCVCLPPSSDLGTGRRETRKEIQRMVQRRVGQARMDGERI